MLPLPTTSGEGVLPRAIADVNSRVADARRLASAAQFSIPTGTLMPWPISDSDPSSEDWLVCQGLVNLYVKAEYPRLWAVVQNETWAPVDATYFALPDLRVKVMMGSFSPSYGITTTGGSTTHTLSTGELPSHSHGSGSLSTGSAGNHNHTTYANRNTNNTATGGSNVLTQLNASASGNTGITSTDGSHTHSISGSTATAGSGTPHNNLPPYYVVDWYMKT